MNIDLRPAFPALILAITGLVVLLAQAFTPKSRRSPSTTLSLAGIAVAFLYVRSLAIAGFESQMGGTLVADEFALFFQGVILAIAALAVVMSGSYLRENEMERGEYYTLILFSSVGMMGLVSAIDLISLFVALEIMSVALYALAGMRRGDDQSQEAAIKYYITGAFASAFFLFGVALLYGLSGSTRLSVIAATIAGSSQGEVPVLAVLGMGLILVGLGFKVGAAPFHMWVPDVYEGSPTPVTGFMAAAVKAAAFGAFLRIFGTALPDLSFQWHSAVAILAILTMVIGNLGALTQKNVKRMLAYSSVAHAGYILVGLSASTQLAAGAVLFYIVAYAAANIGSFGALAGLAKNGREPLTLSDIAGLGRRRPFVAACLTVFMVSLTGVPVSAGFVGKFQLFRAAVYADQTRLAIIAVILSVVSAYYYLHVVVAMYMREPDGPDELNRVTLGSKVVLAVAAVATLALGMFPGGLLDLARLAGQSLP
jgi:NADH-quinone oxidoreductase subunit N